MSDKEDGQTLIELIVVIAVSTVVVGALVFSTISSLRNSEFAKHQAQATKLAQEGIEKMRTLRDRDMMNSISYNDGSHTASKFSDFWSINLVCPTNCYFYFNASGVLIGGTAVNFETISAGNFTRQFQIEDYTDGTQQKKITSVVQWNDFSGNHQSKLITILGKL